MKRDEAGEEVGGGGVVPKPRSNPGMGSPRASTVAAVLGAAIVTAIGVVTVLPRPTIAGVIGLMVLAVCLVALYQATIAESFSPVAVTFWSFVAVWVGFAPLLQIRDRRLPWPDLPLDQHYVSAQMILLMAVVAFWAGYRRRQSPPHPANSPRLEVTLGKAIAITCLAGFLAVACLPRTGGLAVRFMSRDDLQRAITQAGLKGGKDQALLGLLSTLPAAVSFVALILCLLAFRSGRYADTKSRIFLCGTLAVAVILNVIYNNPLSANRFTFFSVVLAAGLTVVRIRGWWWRSAFSAGMLLGLAVVYPLANLFRNDRSREQLRLGVDAYYTWDFDGFQQTVNAVHYVNVHGHTWGHHLLSALLFWVPRSLWESKAIPAGNVVAASRGYQFQNLSLPFWAEVFVEFGFIGVVVVLFFFGVLARRLDGWVGGQPANLTKATALVFAACQIGLLRGPFGAQVPFVGAAFVVLIVGVAGWPRGRLWRLSPSAGGPGDVIQVDGPIDPTADATPEEQDIPGTDTNQPARIVVLADWWWPNAVGGAERSARAAALALSEFAEVSILIPARASAVYDDGPLTVHAVRRPFARRTHPDSAARRGTEFLTTWLLPSTARPLMRKMGELRPDVVVATNISRTGPWLLSYAKRRELKFIRIFHDLSDTCWRRSRMKGSRRCTRLCPGCGVKARVMRNAMPEAALSICVSNFVRSELARVGITSTESSTVGYPLVAATTEDGEFSSRAPGSGTVAGYIGRLDPVKGIESAIRTVAACRRTSGQEISMLVAGEGRASYRGELAKLAAAEAVPVEFVGHMDVDRFCARVDVVLIPSTWLEPFGRVAVEVGSRHRPMLVSPLGGLPEAAALSGGPHMFADFGDPESAGRALAELLSGGRISEGPAAPDAETLKQCVVSIVELLLCEDGAQQWSVVR